MISFYNQEQVEQLIDKAYQLGLKAANLFTEPEETVEEFKLRLLHSEI